MPDFAKLNGTAVRTTGTYRRVVEQDGLQLTEVELVVIVRGSMANRSLKQLLAQEPIHVDLPQGSTSEVFEATLESAQVASSGAGESAAYRYDLTLRETPASAARRAVERVEQPAPAPKPATPAPARRAEPEDDPDEPADLSRVTVAGDPAVWATALKQLQAPADARPAAPPEPPLTPVELAGIEAVLVNLRLDALIDVLEAKGMLSRAEVEGHFMNLVRQRFVEEAIPVVGESAALRAKKDVLG